MRFSSLTKFIKEQHLLLAILLLALLLRLIYFMGIMNSDSVGYAYFAYNLENGTQDSTLVGFGVNRIGLFYPVAILFRIFETSEFVAVLFPLLSSLLSIFFIFSITKTISGRRAAHIASFLWAVFPLDVFLATQLLPDGPNAMATAGSVYFLLRAQRSPKRFAKFAFALLTAFFFVWTFRIKASSTPIVFVLLSLMVLNLWPRLKAWGAGFFNWSKRLQRIILVVGLTTVLLAIATLISKQRMPLAFNNLELTAYDIAPAWILGRRNPLQYREIGGAYWRLSRHVYTPPPSDDSITAPSPSQRLKIFDAYILVFLIAVSYAAITRKKSFFLPLLWFAILFFYLEWGSYPRSLGSPNLFTYLPISHSIDARNFLFTSVPMVIAMALYLAEGFRAKTFNSTLMGASGIVLLFGYALQQAEFSEIALSYIKLAIFFVFALGLASLFILQSASLRNKYSHGIFFGLIVAIGVGSFLPTSFHVWDHFKEQERRENLQSVNRYLENQPSLAIYGVGGEARLLNLYSGFKYGFNHLFATSNSNYPETQMTDDIDLVQREGGYFLRYGCGSPVFEFADWATAEFGNSSSPRCVSLIQHQPLEEAKSELADAQARAENTPSLESINFYLNGAANAEDAEAFVYALSLMAGYFPEEVPIVQASGLIQSFRDDLPGHSSSDLLLSYELEPANWEFGPLLSPSLVAEEDAKTLVVEISGSTEDIQAITLHLPLKAGSAYILDVELRTFAPFDLLRFPGMSIPDTYADSWNQELNWSEYSIVFITPQWAEGERLVSLELARVFDKGSISFRQILLTEVALSE